MPEYANFTFSLATKICFGTGRAGKVGSDLTDLGVHKILVVTDAGVVKAGIIQPVLDSLRQSGVAVAVFQDVKPNPTEKNVEEAVSMARADGCEAILAVGGGSSIDTAKATALLAASGGILPAYEGWDMIKTQPLPTLAIPTTAGTGSEVSYWAVITIEADHRKMVVGSPRIAPVVAVLDPLMTYTLPVDLTAYTGLDALTHAIEAFTSTMSNPISDALAITAVEKIGRSFLKAIESPENEGARSDMLLASTMAALAFNSADLGAVHCLSEALGGMMDVHHGLANAIFLAPVMEFNSPAVAGKYDCLARALGPRDAVSAVRNMVEPLCLPSLRELGVREEDLPRLAKMASQNISVPSNPRQVTEEDFSRLLRQVF